MRKETRSFGKTLATIENNVLTVHCDGRPGVNKLHLDGAKPVQRYVKANGFDVAVKQKEGRNIPDFALTIPSDLNWVTFGGSEKATIATEVGNVLAVIELRRWIKTGSVNPEPAIANHAPAKPVIVNPKLAKPLPVEPKPAVVNPKPAVVNPKPAVVNPKPAEKVTGHQTTGLVEGHKPSSVTISAALAAIIKQAVAEGIAEGLAKANR